MFLKNNCDIARISKPTELGVRATIVRSANGDVTFDSAGEPFAADKVVDALTERYYREDSVLNLFTWRNEAGKCTAAAAKGKGELSSIGTAIRSEAPQIDDAGIAVADLPKALDFTFRAFYKMCPNAYADAGDKGVYHMSSTLAVKLMILFMCEFYRVSGNDLEKFIRLVNLSIKVHYDHHKGGTGASI